MGVSVPVVVLVLDDLRMLRTMAAAPRRVAMEIAENNNCLLIL